MLKHCPLGLFDSGIGGLTVLKKVMQELPYEDLIYLADTARLPFGDKTPQAILRYTLQGAEFLASHAVKLLIIACNTASAHAVDCLREKFPIPVVDVIEPAVELAAQTSAARRIAVLGTRATINSGVYKDKIQIRLPGAEVISIACPLFVPLVEENFLSHPATELIIQEYLEPIQKKKVDTVILGCTHYPLLLPLIRKQFGEEVQIIDSASVCAKFVVKELKKYDLLKPLSQKGNKKYYASEDAEKFQRLGEKILGVLIDSVDTYITEEAYV